MNWSVIIGAVCAICGLLISYLVFVRDRRKEDSEDGSRNGSIMTEIGYIKGGIDDIKAEQREQRKTNSDFVSRIVAVEESTKQAHKRLDGLEGKVDHDR